MSPSSWPPPGPAPELLAQAHELQAPSRQSLHTLLTLALELGAGDVAAVCWCEPVDGPLLPDIALPLVAFDGRGQRAQLPDLSQFHQRLVTAVTTEQPWPCQACVPVLDAGQLRGHLWLLRREARALNAAEALHLQTVAELLAQQWQQALHTRQLNSHLARLQDLVRASGDWSWELDAQLRYVWLGGDYAAVMGEDPARLLGQTGAPERLVDAQGQAWPDEVDVHDVLARQQPVSRLLSVCPGAQGERFLSRSAVPITDEHGRFQGFRGTTRDLTRQMRSDSEARAQHQAFEALQRDKERAELASRAKSGLLSRVSHELRTPLNAVLGFSQLMAADPAPVWAPAQAARLAGIATAGQRLLVVVDDLLELVGVERHAGVGLPEVQDLQQAAGRAVQAWQARAALAGRTLQWRDHGPVHAHVAPSAVDQILNRLLSDALACGSAAAPVRVVARLEDAQALLDVSHATLPGAALDLGRLFDPFDFTGVGDGATQSSGLDLVIARDLARSCGGDAAAYLGSDAELHILVSLPTGTASAPQATPASAKIAQVLYVEDEPLNVVLMQEIFRGRPEWQLHIASDGSEGVALAKTLQPDLMLIDINLPDFGGLEVLRRLRADPATQAIPAIALSADAMAEQVAAARAAGFQDYWTKPIDLNALLQDVAAALAKPR